MYCAEIKGLNNLKKKGFLKKKGEEYMSLLIYIYELFMIYVFILCFVK